MVHNARRPAPGAGLPFAGAAVATTARRCVGRGTGASGYRFNVHVYWGSGESARACTADFASVEESAKPCPGSVGHGPDRRDLLRAGRQGNSPDIFPAGIGHPAISE